MAFEVVKKRDWIVTGPDGQPVEGLRCTVEDKDTGDTFNVDVPGKSKALVTQYVQKGIDEHKGVVGMTFD